MAEGKNNAIDRIADSEFHLTDWIFNFFSDYVTLFYYKIMGNGCRPVKKNDGNWQEILCCDVSKKISKKSRIRLLCDYKAADLDCIVQKKRSDGVVKYEYCRCVQEEKKKLINQVCVLLDELKRGRIRDEIYRLSGFEIQAKQNRPYM